MWVDHPAGRVAHERSGRRLILLRFRNPPNRDHRADKFAFVAARAARGGQAAAAGAAEEPAAAADRLLAEEDGGRGPFGFAIGASRVGFH